MTTTSTASKAGKDPKVDVKERPHGLARVSEQEFYHLTALIRDCLHEAEACVEKVHTSASERFLDFDGQKSEPLDFLALSRNLGDAHDCLILAVQHLDDLRFGTHSRVLNSTLEVIGVFCDR
jgi:hypothetical protein